MIRLDLLLAMFSADLSFRSGSLPYSISPCPDANAIASFRGLIPCPIGILTSHSHSLRNWFDGIYGWLNLLLFRWSIVSYVDRGCRESERSSENVFCCGLMI